MKKIVVLMLFVFIASSCFATDRTLDTGNNLYTGLLFALDGQSSAKDLKSGSTSWDATPTKNGNAFVMNGQVLTMSATPTGPVSIYIKMKMLTNPAYNNPPQTRFYQDGGNTFITLGGAYRDSTTLRVRDGSWVYDNSGGSSMGGTTHEIIINIPAASGNAVAFVLDGSAESMPGTTGADWTGAQTMDRFTAGNDDTIELETVLLWSNRTITASDISNYLATLFDSAATPLNAPTLLTPADTATGVSVGTSLTISDTNTSPNEAGIIFRIKASGGSYSYSSQQAANTTSISAATVLGSALANSTEYFWSAIAKGDGSTTEDSDYATDFSFTTAAASTALPSRRGLMGVGR